MLSGVRSLSKISRGSPQVATKRLCKSSRTSRGCLEGPTNIKHSGRLTYDFFLFFFVASSLGFISSLPQLARD
jgi:hypothetical protein